MRACVWVGGCECHLLVPVLLSVCVLFYRSRFESSNSPSANTTLSQSVPPTHHSVPITPQPVPTTLESVLVTPQSVPSAPKSVPLTLQSVSATQC